MHVDTRRLSVPSCQFGLSFRHQWRETFFFLFTRFKICHARLEQGRAGERRQDTAAPVKCGFDTFLIGNATLEQRNFAMLTRIIQTFWGRCRAELKGHAEEEQVGGMGGLKCSFTHKPNNALHCFKLQKQTMALLSFISTGNHYLMTLKQRVTRVKF